ncbi:MAG: hypothetical protein KDD62_13705, partial [Bdellovibrionales bacterium]|nr:hypothetical protein [Bdellovibrionales bacterium]
MEPTNDLRSGRPNEPRESIVPLLERHSISELVAVLQESAEKHLPQLDSILHDLLLKSELTVFEEVNQLAFKEGSWFRPIHNRVVPLCMLHIISATDCQRDLMYPALNHDAGMSLIAIECTHAGADWENKDKRKLHMELGAAYCRQQLTNLQAQGTLLITAGRINQLAEIVGTHDNPYLGIDLVAEEAKLVRDADRCFVMSFTSFWKDFLAYRSDDNYLERYRAQGLLLLPQDLLAARLAFFYDSFESFPTV